MSATMVAAFLVSLLVRHAGSYYSPVDGWGVCLFEVAMGGLCLSRYLDRSWRSSQPAARTLPLVLGAACTSWALGDVALTIEQFGGATAPSPSVADLLYLGFFPLAFVSLMMVIRRGSNRSLVATSLDGLIAGLGVACLSAAFLFDTIVRSTGDSALSAATNMAYPLGDVLLLAVAIGGLTILPKEYRRFLVIAGVALTANATGDTFNLLQPNSHLGYVANGVAWPISLLMLAIAAWVQPSTAWAPSAHAELAGAEKKAGFAFPALGAAGAMLVLFAFSFSLGHVGRVAVDLATATLLVAGVRLALTVRAAQALHTARFRSLIDNAWDVIVVADADLGVAYITPSSARVLGYPPDELQGSSLSQIVHPNDTDVMVEHLRRLGEGATETAAFETRMRRRNGEWRTIAWTATNLLADPAVHGYVLNGGDVTDARHAAEDLATARDEAITASKAKSEFLATMSHEIRTPMNAVIGLTELLLGTGLDREQRELATGVSVSAENLLTIINDILDFSKIEAGKIDLEEVALNVAGLADDVGRILAEAAHTKGIELLVDVHPDVPASLLGDPVRVQQVLLNLASNAVKFTPEGEVVIRVRLVDLNGERVALRFEVIDVGIGIAPSDQERLFSPFAQADSSTTRRFGGTGLGLAICRQLVDLMGGTLGLTSTPGEGSTFWFELSLRRADAPDVSADGAELKTLAGRRALIVDDNATNRMILRQQMLSWGVETVEAVDGSRGLEAAAVAVQDGRPFDLGVLDLNMPGMDGLELASALKADPDTAAIVLFLLSSSGQRLSAAESHVRGLAGTLTKPVRQSELFDCLITGLNDGVPASHTTATATGETELSEVRGMILLVEDNTMNQLVASKMLAKLGFAFDIANHGGEAVAAVIAHAYDAILMDCQMPEMDGYEATAEIRRIEGTARHTPIIAMTAAAMDGDRETCLAAGMDDYITKPVRPDAIDAVLARWIKPIVEDAPDAGTPTDSTDGGASEPLDREQVELLRGLDDGAGAVLAEIVDQYLAQTAQGREDLVRMLDEGDPEALRRAAHALKGASANVGASALAEVCAQLEARGRFGQLDGATDLVGRFDAEFTRVREALTSVLASG